MRLFYSIQLTKEQIKELKALIDKQEEQTEWLVDIRLQLDIIQEEQENEEKRKASN